MSESLISSEKLFLFPGLMSSFNHTIYKLNLAFVIPCPSQQFLQLLPNFPKEAEILKKLKISRHTQTKPANKSP